MMFSCKKAAVLLSKELDAELGRGGMLKLKCHLLICRACRTLQRQLHLQKHAARMPGEEDAPSSTQNQGTTLPESSRQRIKDLLK
jgi:hypothetical protein